MVFQFSRVHRNSLLLKVYHTSCVERLGKCIKNAPFITSYFYFFLPVLKFSYPLCWKLHLGRTLLSCVFLFFYSSALISIWFRFSCSSAFSLKLCDVVFALISFGHAWSSLSKTALLWTGFPATLGLAFFTTGSCCLCTVFQQYFVSLCSDKAINLFTSYNFSYLYACWSWQASCSKYRLNDYLSFTTTCTDVAQCNYLFYKL